MSLYYFKKYGQAKKFEKEHPTAKGPYRTGRSIEKWKVSLRTKKRRRRD